MFGRKKDKEKEKAAETPKTNVKVTVPPPAPKPEKYSCVTSAGYYCDQNARHRGTMEDEHVIVDKFGNREKDGFFAIYDGHGGRQVVEYVAKQFHENVLKEFSKCKAYQESSWENKKKLIAERKKEQKTNNDDTKDSKNEVENSPYTYMCISKALQAAFKITDEEICAAKQKFGYSGATAIVCYLAVEERRCRKRSKNKPEEKKETTEKPQVQEKKEGNDDKTEKKEEKKEIIDGVSVITDSSESEEANKLDKSSSAMSESKKKKKQTPKFKIQTTKRLYVGNIGDARAVLCRGGSAVRLSMDHKPSVPSEVKRLEALQCFVINEKVGGVLAVSRAFGDAEFKPFVCAVPYLLETVITPKDSFIILACDGLWDVCTDQEAVDLIKDSPDPKFSSKKLVQFALEHGTTDNVTVVVILL